jgi:hypothetical protein
MEGSTILRLEELVHDLLAETSHRGVKSPRRLTPSVFPVNLGLRGHAGLQLFVFYMIKRCNGVFAQHLSNVKRVYQDLYKLPMHPALGLSRTVCRSAAQLSQFGAIELTTARVIPG